MELLKKLDYKHIFAVAARRFVEMLLTAVILSAIVALLNVTGRVTSYVWVLLLILLINILYFCIDVPAMRRCYFALRGSLDYYIANFLALFVFGVVSTLLCATAANVFTWMFLVAKFLHCLPYGISTLKSLFFFIFAVALAIIFAPFGLDDMIQRINEEDEFYDNYFPEDKKDLL